MPSTSTSMGTSQRLLGRQIGETTMFEDERTFEIKECEWHEGQPDDDCSECEALYEAQQEMLMDAAREDRGE